MTIIAVQSTSNTKCGHKLSAGATSVSINNSKVGISGDNSGGTVSRSQNFVKIEGKAVLLEGDSVGGHGDSPHTPQSLKTSPQQFVSIN